jgi:hypothetical protein
LDQACPERLRILESLTSFFQLFARTVGNVLGRIDYFSSRLLGGIGSVVDFVFRFVFQIAHRFSPFDFLLFPGQFAFLKKVFGPIAEVARASLQGIGCTTRYVANTVTRFATGFRNQEYGGGHPNS